MPAVWERLVHPPVRRGAGAPRAHGSGPERAGEGEGRLPLRGTRSPQRAERRGDVAGTKGWEAVSWAATDQSSGEDRAEVSVVQRGANRSRGGPGGVRGTHSPQCSAGGGRQNPPQAGRGRAKVTVESPARGKDPGLFQSPRQAQWQPERRRSVSGTLPLLEVQGSRMVYPLEAGHATP